MTIAVIGCHPRLPEVFPILMEENSGNMVHAVAPLKMFYPYAVHSSDESWKLSGEESFRNFVNKKCSHLIITLANILRLGRVNGESYERFKKSLEQYDVPFVVFGLGVQGDSFDIDNAYLCPEAISLVKFLSEKSALLGCRGEFTKKVIEKLCGVDNSYVTGCPSFFSNPYQFDKIEESLHILKARKFKHSKPAFNITGAQKPSERKILVNGISEDLFQIEPVMKSAYEYSLFANSGGKCVVPYFLKRSVIDKELSENQILEFYAKNFRMFRCPDVWGEFVKESVSFSYGSRFHCNMQTILSGKPALWFTHDARTSELVDYLNLPNLSIDDAVDMQCDELIEGLSYDQFFNGLGSLFSRFNYYLTENGLSEVEVPKVVGS